MQTVLHDAALLVFIGSAVGTFVALVLAEEQQTRMRNGAFSAAAGSAFGGLAGLFNDEASLLVVGFVGSAVGGLGGWLVHLLLSMAAASKRFRPLLEYQYGGIASVRQRLLLDEQELLLSGLRDWRYSFVRRVEMERSRVLEVNDPVERQRIAEMLVLSWLQGIIEVFGLVFDIAGKTGYRSRATVILFGRDEEGQVLGKHWITYAGKLPRHKVTRVFPEESIGYQVLTEQVPSPFFFTAHRAMKAGVPREEPTYRPFYTFRLNQLAILAIDWPQELHEHDPYVVLAKDTFHGEICPAITDLLDAWQSPLSPLVELRPL